jgi:hypothetical protein
MGGRRAPGSDNKRADDQCGKLVQGSCQAGEMAGTDQEGRANFSAQSVIKGKGTDT